MAISNLRAFFTAGLDDVWRTVVSLDDVSWRSDLSRIEVTKPGKEFVEYTKSGYATKFVITAFEPGRRYEFDMENENMKGHWSGFFSYEDGKTIVDFRENVTAKKYFMKPFVKMYLKKQQDIYVSDLKKKLRE